MPRVVSVPSWLHFTFLEGCVFLHRSENEQVVLRRLLTFYAKTSKHSLQKPEIFRHGYRIELSSQRPGRRPEA